MRIILVNDEKNIVGCSSSRIVNKFIVNRYGTQLNTQSY